MKRTLKGCFLAALLTAAPAAAQPTSVDWQPAASLTPTGCTAGFAQGVSAPFAGTVSGTPLVAGGCNFPETPASQGGKKRFYSDIYRFDGQWLKMGNLPQPTAYGLSLTAPEGLVCVGGQSPQGSLTAAYVLQPAKKGRRIKRTPLPDLPYPIDNAAGALIGRRVYVVGGNVAGQPSRRMFSLSLDSLELGWREEASLPGAPRTQAVAVPLMFRGERCLYVFGGFAAGATEAQASVSTLSLFFVPSQGRWYIAAAPTDRQHGQVALGGGAGYALNDTLAVVCGGVNKDVFLAALRREGALAEAVCAGDTERSKRLGAEKKAYMEMPPADYRFNTHVLVYNACDDRWHVLSDVPQAARAGAAIVGSGRSFYQIGGETKPGIRTAEVWQATIHP